MSGYKEQWRGLLLSAIFTAGRKPLQLKLFVAAGTVPRLETNLQSRTKMSRQQSDGVG